MLSQVSFLGGASCLYSMLSTFCGLWGFGFCFGFGGGASSSDSDDSDSVSDSET